MLDELMGRVAARFGRVEPRRTARALVAGLLSDAERKNCWWLAEWAGHRSPDAMQRLLRTARWDADLVRDDVRGYVARHLGHRDGVLVADETGFVKKGSCSAGVQREYTGTAGKVENAQVGVFLAYVSPRGRALIDRALYLPRSWTGDPGRCQAAGSCWHGVRLQAGAGPADAGPRAGRRGPCGLGDRRRGLRRRPGLTR